MSENTASPAATAAGLGPLTVSHDYHPRALALFNNDVAGHQMTVKHDDGLYRHILFMPKNGFGWFSIITTPGQLTLWGDHGCWVFARTDDMFDFFRGNNGYVNAGYWAEKLVAGRGEVKQFSYELWKSWVVRDFWDRRTEYSPIAAKMIWTELVDTLFDRYYDDPQTADDAYRTLDGIDFKGRHPELFRWNYPEAYEHIEDWKEWNFHLLWSMHAILWGIRQYDASKAQK
jgi:hypothetical protein